MTSIRTERLTIIAFPLDRPVPNLASKRNVKKVLDLQSRRERTARAETDAEVRRSQQDQAEMQWACINEADLVHVGDVTEKWNRETQVTYLGYSILPKYQGRGYATESVRAVTERLLSASEVKAIMAETFSDGSASVRVMEKAGMSRIDTELGSDIVRYALVKPGSDVDLAEGDVVTLKPFIRSKADRLDALVKWQMRRWEELLPIVLLAAMAIHNADEITFTVGVLGVIGYASYLTVRLVASLRQESPEELIQLRAGGMLYANRTGSGGVTPWTVFPHFRLPHRGGLELWNGVVWYWLPPQAFTDSLLTDARTFLTESGVKDRTKQKSK